MLRETLQRVNAECSDEYGRMADGYLAQMERFSTYLDLQMSYLILVLVDLDVHDVTRKRQLCRKV